MACRHNLGFTYAFFEVKCVKFLRPLIQLFLFICKMFSSRKKVTVSTVRSLSTTSTFLDKHFEIDIIELNYFVYIFLCNSFDKIINIFKQLIVVCCFQFQLISYKKLSYQAYNRPHFHSKFNVLSSSIYSF